MNGSSLDNFANPLMSSKNVENTRILEALKSGVQQKCRNTAESAAQASCSPSAWPCAFFRLPSFLALLPEAVLKLTWNAHSNMGATKTSEAEETSDSLAFWQAAPRLASGHNATCGGGLHDNSARNPSAWNSVCTFGKSSIYGTSKVIYSIVHALK